MGFVSNVMSFSATGKIAGALGVRKSRVDRVALAISVIGLGVFGGLIGSGVISGIGYDVGAGIFGLMTLRYAYDVGKQLLVTRGIQPIGRTTFSSAHTQVEDLRVQALLAIQEPEARKQYIREHLRDGEKESIKVMQNVLARKPLILAAYITVNPSIVTNPQASDDLHALLRSLNTANAGDCGRVGYPYFTGNLSVYDAGLNDRCILDKLKSICENELHKQDLV